MARHTFFTAAVLPAVVLILCVGLTGRVASQQPQTSPRDSQKERKKSTDPWDEPPPKIKLRKVPAIVLLPRAPMTKENATRIKRCIALLAEMESPDFDLPATFGGHAFLPLSGQRQSIDTVLTDRHLKSSGRSEPSSKSGPRHFPSFSTPLTTRHPQKSNLRIVVGVVAACG